MAIAEAPDGSLGRCQKARELDRMSTFKPELIFDVGMNDGSDTAYYLFKGFNVIAVEANPTLCEAAAKRFSEAVAAGRLRIENVAIAKDPGVLPFYISSKDIWSSFDRATATKDGCTATALDVTCLRTADLFAKYGVPYYLKVDIEGADSFCLADLDANCLPVYLSFECGKESSGEVKKLEGLGYKRFKLINQAWLEFRSDFEKETGSRRLRRRLRRKINNVMRGRWHNEWRFEGGSSGPFGEDADGDWVTANEFLAIHDRWKKLDDLHSTSMHSFWFDVHAAR
jgi:FkbM family methyltransferase